MRICDLKKKEVINSCNCKVLGCADDLIFDLCNGCVTAIIVPGPSKLCGIVPGEYEYIIPYKCIVQIGPDVILVRVDEEEVKRKVKIS